MSYSTIWKDNGNLASSNFDFQAFSLGMELSVNTQKELFSLFSKLKERNISLAIIKGAAEESILDTIPVEFSITKEALQSLGGLSYILKQLKLEAEDALF